jgi:Tol biopolymer transport system component
LKPQTAHYEEEKISLQSQTAHYEEEKISLQSQTGHYEVFPPGVSGTLPWGARGHGCKVFAAFAGIRYNRLIHLFRSMLMPKSRFASLLPFIILPLILACAIPTLTATPSANPIDGAVARTLTALAPTAAPAAASATPTAAASATLAPTETALPPEASPAPEGLRIAYTDANRNLWLWVQGGANTALTSSGDVTEGRISPDGSLVAFVRSADYLNFSLWVINPDGTEERQLVSAADFTSFRLDSEAISTQPIGWGFVPGRRTIAFTTSPTHEGPGFMINDDLWYVEADSGALRQVFAAGLGGMFYFSPDGQQMALVTPTTISLANVDGSNRRANVLVYPAVITYSEFMYYVEPKWAPDSSYLRVVLPPEDPLATPVQETKIYQMLLDGSPATLLTGFVAAPFDGGGMLSPDLSKVAFMRQSGAAEDNIRELHVMNADGAADTLYQTGQMLVFSGWMPDSARFVFQMGYDTAPKMGQSGAGFVPLTDVATMHTLEWLGDDQFIILTRTGSSWELRIGYASTASSVLFNIPGDPAQYTPSFDVWE